MVTKFLSLPAPKMPKPSREGDVTLLDSDKLKSSKKLSFGNLSKWNGESIAKSLTKRFLDADVEKTYSSDKNMSTSKGKFGKYGGSFVPETLVSSFNKLEADFNSAINDPKFQEELATALRDYAGRETPLYFARNLTNHYKNSNGEGPDIYIKREDLCHGGAYKINNAIGQAMLARRLGFKRVATATGAGQHGVATVAACAKLGLECTVFMGDVDMERQSSNVVLMNIMGAKVKSVKGTFKDATSEAMRSCVENLDTTYLLIGSAVGPHPYPPMVRYFQSIVGNETRKQAMEKWGGKPDVLIACVGSGSNALGLFHEFIGDKDVRLIGVEGGGCGYENGEHSASLIRGSVGVYHSSMCYMLQDEEGQIVKPHSIAVGLEYPGVSPELSFLKDIGRAEFHSTTDQEAIEAHTRLAKLEGIIPALEASHAFALLERLSHTLANGTKVVINCSGRGDKDALIVERYCLESSRTAV